MTTDKTPLRIVVTAGHAPSLVRFRGRLLRDMVGLGHTVTALAPAEPSSLTRNALAGMGVALETIPLARRGMNPLADLRTLSALTRIFRSHNPDLVLNYTIKPVIWGGLAARRAGIGRVFSLITGLGRAFSGRGGVWGSALEGLVTGLYRRALAKNELVLFQNPEDEALFRSRGVLAENAPTLVVPGSGVDLEEFPAQPPADPPPVFLCLARLIEDKGVLEYAETARRLQSVFPQVRFLLAGAVETGPGAVDPSEIARRQDEKGLEYLGEVADVRPLLARCTAFVLPSSYGEGLPRSSLEALASARPVVTTDHTGCRLAVDHGETGLLVRPRDVDDLAAALTRFIREPGLAADMGRAARKAAEERFDVNLVNRMILAGMGLVDKEAGA